MTGSRLTLHHKRTLKAFGFNTAQDYKEIINGTRGYVECVEQLFGAPTGNLPADRTAAILRQTRLLNPHLLLKDVAANVSLARDGGAALLDGAVHHLVVVSDSVHPLPLYVNAQTGRISKLVTLENDPLHRDVPIEVFYLGWEPVNVYLSSNGHLLHAESRTKVTANSTFVESTFQFPAAASPVDNAEDTVESLAAEAACSRATFARRFRELVGAPPLTYLTDLRMTVASRLLRDGEESLATIARRVGYASEVAFNRTFHRVRGVPPGRYRDQARAALEGPANADDTVPPGAATASLRRAGV